MLRIFYCEKGIAYRKKLYNCFAEDIKKGNNALMLVPEQFTVHAEREIYSIVGAFAGNCEVVSFKRLCYRILFAAGRLHSSKLDKAGQSAVLYRALKQVENELQYFSSIRNTPSFITKISEFKDELTRCGISNQDIMTALPKLKGRFSDKLTELSLILSAYEGIIEQIGESVDSDIASAAKALEQTDAFSGYNIYIDGFFSFSAEQYKLLSRLMQRCNISVSLMCDSLHDKTGGYGLFSDIQSTAATLIHSCTEAGQPIEKIYVADNDYYKSEKLAFVANNAFKTEKTYTGKDNSVILYNAVSPYDEALFAVSRIKELVRSGYTYNDFALLVRDEASYLSVVDSTFSLYNIPLFADKKTSLSVKPIALFIKNALLIALNKFTTDDVITYVKTGLAGISEQEIAVLQRYCDIWMPKPSMWLSGDFQGNPNGFKEGFTDAEAETLKKINQIKNRIIEPILELKAGLAGTGKDFCRALYGFGERLNICESLSCQSAVLEAENEAELSQESGQSYECYVKALEQLYIALGDVTVTAEEFYNMITCCLNSYDIGRIPTLMDGVLFGTPDRLKCLAKKCVILLGMNDGIFPQSIPDTGLISDRERGILSNAGVELDAKADEKMLRERFYAYYCYCLPSERLIITTAANGNGGEELSESHYFTSLAKQSSTAVLSEDENPLQDRNMLFNSLIKSNFEDKKLLDFFAESDDYSEALQRAVAMKHFGENEIAVSDRLNKSLEQGNMLVSPTRIESFFNCRFAHYCKYILGIRKDDKAEMSKNHVGTFVHHVLENILNDTVKLNTDLWSIPKEQLTERVEKLASDYLSGILGGADNKTDRFLSIFNSIKQTVIDIIMHLCEELENCEFKPVDFELNIGKTIPSMMVNFEGGSIGVHGFVDRVDMLKTPDKDYIRVVDYKTGNKKFSMEDYYNGLNLQMPMYLFSICKNGNGYYGRNPMPAGVLYSHARELSPATVERNDSKAKQQNKDSFEKYDGRILDDLDIISAMDTNQSQKFLPYRIKNDGTLYSTSKVISPKGFEAMEKQLERLIVEMGQELKKGCVTANPIKDKENSCRYCDYKSVCGYEPTKKGRELKPYKGSEFEAEVNGVE